MPLTPADVHNVAFSKPPIGKRGYNEDEVDAFLDLVENELTRLIEENSDLRQRIEELDRELGGGAAAAPTQAIRTFEPEPAPEPVQPVVTPEAAAAGTNEEQAMRAARVLTLAQVPVRARRYESPVWVRPRPRRRARGPAPLSADAGRSSLR